MSTNKHAHVTLNLGETDAGGYHFCNECGSKTALVTTSCCWEIDEEPFASGEVDADLAHRDVTTWDELSGHYCPTCDRLTSFSFNGRFGKKTPSAKATRAIKAETTKSTTRGANG